ncbi:MAG: glycosyltransferase family 4 protein [Gammaproteobacteria bacterium]|nr:glycosyltransferase family 4 protein [Gammaproteobacteria bacterium]
MKLAFCLFKYFPHGGLQHNFIRIVLACQQRSHDVHVYAQIWEGEKPQHIPVNIVPCKGLTNHKRALNFAKNLNRILKEQHYDCVIGFNKMPGLDVYFASDICYKERALETRGIWYSLTSRYKTYVALEESVFAKEAETQILLLCEKQKIPFIQYYQTPETRFHLLPSNINRERIAPQNTSLVRQKLRQSCGIKPDQKIVLMVGSAFKTKGIDRAIRALASLPDALRNKSVLWIVGRGKEKPYLKLAKTLNVPDQVVFKGASNRISEFYAVADLFIHPAYKENTGNVLLEAMLSGLPILTTATCGFAHHIEKAQAGIVLPLPFDQIAFNQALETMLISEKNEIWREHALSYTREMKFCDNTEQIVDIILSGVN